MGQIREPAYLFPPFLTNGRETQGEARKNWCSYEIYLQNPADESKSFWWSIHPASDQWNSACVMQIYGIRKLILFFSQLPVTIISSKKKI